MDAPVPREPVAPGRVDGVVLGHVWHNGRRWIATAKGLPGPVADCDTFRAALLALACEAEPW
jgi:hypothetical protein